MKKLILLCLLLSGCATLNCANNNTAGDNNRPAIKTDSEQTPSSAQNVALPVSVGAQPNSTGTVNK